MTQHTPEDERDTLQPRDLTRAERRALAHAAAREQERIGDACIEIQKNAHIVATSIIRLADIADELEGVSTP